MDIVNKTGKWPQDVRFDESGCRFKRSCLFSLSIFYSNVSFVHDISRSLGIVYVEIQKSF